uniref:Uncharacterized protein n=1 Tax=Knipowitschia caucasica TaxID=637954 RepID=A0AAV2MH36_KNICA
MAFTETWLKETDPNPALEISGPGAPLRTDRDSEDAYWSKAGLPLAHLTITRSIFGLHTPQFYEEQRKNKRAEVEEKGASHRDRGECGTKGIKLQTFLLLSSLSKVMAAVSSSLREEQFICSICLEVFTDPVTTSCGHSFCSICINKHWDTSVHCSCPLCKQEQGEEQQATLKKQIKDRRVKVQEIHRSVEQSQRKSDAEIQEGLRVFTALMECVQQSADSFKQSIVEKHQKVEEEASQLIEQILGEISELEQRGAEMEQLWTSGDHLSFVQIFTTVKPAPQLRDWSQKTVRTPSYKGTGAQAVSELRNKLNTEMETFFKAELEKVQEFAAEVSLDPDTAHPYLVLSKDLKQVHHGKMKFSSGKFYFEVQVKGKRGWNVGVAKESVVRKDAAVVTCLKVPPSVRTRTRKRFTANITAEVEEKGASHRDRGECGTKGIKLQTFLLLSSLSKVMAAVSSSLREEQFICSICLEVFTDPVTTSCGHSFCSICINKHWDTSVHCSCPLCKQEQGEEQQATLKKQIKDRRVKVQEIHRSVEQSQRKSDAEIQEGLRVFTALMECVQQSADSFKQSIVEKHQKVEEEASQLIEQILGEISELEQRGAEMEQLWTSGDHLSFVQIFTTVKPAPQLRDWSQKTVRTPSYKGTGAQAVSELRNKLNTEMETFFKAELEKVQEFAAEVSLDPDTAHPYLVLSKDLKQVHHGKMKFSSGKFYFEVQVKGKRGWNVGVAKESVVRKVMAAVSSSLCEEQFLCSICLEVFTDPVTTPCGHSFCSICINKHWDTSVLCSCPVCKQDFSPRPQLKVNTFMLEMISLLRNKPQDEDTLLEAQSTAPGEVCDLSTAPGEVCDLSTAPGEVCDLYTAPGEVCDLSTAPGEVCDLSTAPGEVDCDVCPEPRLRALKSCLLCLMSYCESHLLPHLTNPRLKRHQLIHPLPNLEEHICPKHQRPLELFCRDHSHFMCVQCSYTEDTKHHTVLLKKQGEEQQATLKKQIKDRRVKVQEIQRSVEQSQRKSDAEIQEGLRVFTALMECVQQSADSFKQSIVEKHQKVEEEASQLIEQIQTEISELEQRGAEMEQLWTSGDHLSFVQTFTTVKPAPQLRDWSQKTVRTPSYKGTGAQAVSELRNKLNTEMETFFKAELEKVQEFAAEVSLDPDNAHPNLGKQKFSSGKFYFEVQVKGKTDWEVGVAKESVDRKDQDSQTSCPEKLGVFVDYDEGLVSFYDVDKKSLLWSFTDCGFTDNILPMFNPCNNEEEPRLRALKSCLLCLTSYCESHLQPHLTNPRLKRHQLIHPLPNLQEHICPEHQRPLELFCRDHSHFMCVQCSYTEDTKHHTVLLKEQGEEQQATLKKQIKDRRVKVQKIQRSVEQSQRKADAEIQEGLRVFTALMECVQQSADSFKQSIVEKHQKVEEEASQLIEQIQTEISELEQRGAEMEQLWTSGDHLSFVQTFTTVKPAPQLRDWSQKTVRTPSYKGTGAQAVSELRNKLNTEMETFFKAELEKVQEFAAETFATDNPVPCCSYGPLRQVTALMFHLDVVVACQQ